MQATSWAILGVVGLATSATAGDWLLKLASETRDHFVPPGSSWELSCTRCQPWDGSM